MPNRIYIIIAFVISSVGLFSQSTNVDCASAFNIDNPIDYCSNGAEFDNTDAGGSGVPEPDCWSDTENDLWFSFTAHYEAASFIVDAETDGDMGPPQINIYTGDCSGSLEDLMICDKANTGDDIVAVFANNLLVGQIYYVRIDAKFGRDGTFAFCMKNYSLPVLPGPDCSTGSILCDKSQITIESVSGNGDDDDERDGSCLGDGVSDPEGTRWFKWTSGTSGTLTFDITPLIPTDDFDFALFRMTNGIDDCELELLRCNATESGSDHLCGTSTGLSLTADDITEDEDCELDDDINTDEIEDGYVRFIDMVEGESYALIITNFDDEGGFTINFGGTGAFLGPEIEIEINPIPADLCSNIFEVDYISNSSFDSLSWFFGDDATPSNASGNGPFNVEYASVGLKRVLVSAISEEGCRITQEQFIDIGLCEYQNMMTINTENLVNATCGNSDGMLEVSGDVGCPTFEFNIDGGSYSTSTVFSGLSPGAYLIGMRDSNGCETFQDYTIEDDSDLELDLGQDITINLGESVDLNGSTSSMGDITISWTPNENVICPDGSTNCLDPTITPTETTTYTINVTDENGCIAFDMITVFVDVCGGSNLGIVIDSIGSFVCQGENTGYVSLSGVNGPPQFQYSIDNINFSDSGIFDNLGVGDYTFTIMDGLGCVRDTLISISISPPFNVSAGDDVTFNTSGDTIFLDGSTDAFGIESITWSPSSNIICLDGSLACLNPIATPTSTSLYTLTVVDENGCSESDDILLTFSEIINVYAPNIFSPNDDGVNDFFTLLADPGQIELIEELRIFDRWGNKVYEGFNLLADDPFNGWDGSFNGLRVEAGVYSWFAKVRYITSPNENAEEIFGNVTLIR